SFASQRTRRYPPRLCLDHSHCPVLVPATLAALPSTRAIPDRDVFYVTRVPAAPLKFVPRPTRSSLPRDFAFYVADPRQLRSLAAARIKPQSATAATVSAGDTPATTALSLMYRKRLRRTNIGYGVPRAAYDSYENAEK